jgi:hypothetical protein
MSLILIMAFRLRTIIQPFSLAAGIRCDNFRLNPLLKSAQKQPVFWGLLDARAEVPASLTRAFYA